jgi:hypothetical protein
VLVISAILLEEFPVRFRVAGADHPISGPAQLAPCLDGRWALLDAAEHRLEPVDLVVDWAGELLRPSPSDRGDQGAQLDPGRRQCRGGEEHPGIAATPLVALGVDDVVPKK